MLLQASLVGDASRQSPAAVRIPSCLLPSSSFLHAALALLPGFYRDGRLCKELAHPTTLLSRLLMFTLCPVANKSACRLYVCAPVESRRWNATKAGAHADASHPRCDVTHFNRLNQQHSWKLPATSKNIFISYNYKKCNCLCKSKIFHS